MAILAVLGLRGEASRERLASLLWENGTGRANLRVELHRLADAIGASLFDPGEDPLTLPSWVEVDAVGGEGDALEGIEGLSTDLDRWIEEVRTHDRRSGLKNRRASEAAASLALELRPPFLVVVRARPADEVDDFLNALADGLRLPMVEGCAGPSRAVHTVAPPYPDDLVQAVLDSREAAWVVRVPAYGEDPRPVLELRNAYDPARTRYIELPEVPWEDARAHLLRDLPFWRAAEAYLWSGGNAGFLRELARMKWAREGDGALAIPQRVRAAYTLEIRYASLEARLALERLSVHPGPITDSLVDTLEARDALDELERRGWLAFDGHWRFRDPESRTVIYRSLQRGRRVSYHRSVALQMAVEGSWLGEVYHRIAAGQPVAWSDAGDVPEGMARDAVRASLGLEVEGSRPRTVATAVGREIALLEVGRHGEGVDGEGADWTFVKVPGQGPTALTFELPDESCLVRLQGHCWAQAPLGVGLEGRAIPLELELADGSHVVFLSGIADPVVRDGALLLPLDEALDTWVALPAAPDFRVSSSAEAAILELQITLHEIGAVRSGRGADDELMGPAVVDAIDVEGSLAMCQAHDPRRFE